MATATPSRYDSSAGELSSPPSAELSEPGSPSRRAKRDADGMVVGEEHRRKQQKRRNPEPIETPPPFEEYRTVASDGNGPPKRYGLLEGKWIQLTAAGMPRKKPGRKPGTIVTPKNTKIEDDVASDTQTKQRKQRKPRESSEGLGPKKRKSAVSAELEAGASSGTPGAAPASTHGNGTSNLQQPPHFSNPTTSSSNHNSPVQHPQSHPENRYSPSPSAPKRESGYPSSMKSILNDDTPSSYSPSNTSNVPVRTSGQSYDPIRGNYDPIRETYSTAGSPRPPVQSTSNRSHSIASLIDPAAPQSPSNSHQKTAPTSAPRFQDSPVSGSPTTQPAKLRQSTGPASVAQSESEKKRDAPPAPRPVIKESNFATIANGPVKKIPEKMRGGTGVSTPKTDIIDDLPGEGDGRSILDFGKAKPGEEQQTPTIVLRIPLAIGETNKYVNFTRLAEEQYGWDALHPRLAANRDRKARIAAAAATLEKESGRESGDEMSVDLSEAEGSNPENGGTSNPEGPTKPKKKRNFKEDQYDVQDDFVDDSDMLWEAQAAASRDGFFVYSGPLIPEEEKPAAGYVLHFQLLPLVVLCSVIFMYNANFILVGEKVRQSVAEVAAVEAAEDEVDQLEAHLVLALAVAVALVLAVGPSLESHESPSQRDYNESAKKQSARMLLYLRKRRIRPAMFFNQPHQTSKLAK